MNQSISQSKQSKSQAVNWGRQLLNLLLTLALALGLLSPATVPAARADSDPPRAHPALLQLAAEHPDDTFMVIIQREVKNKDLKDDDPETAVEEAGGKVRKQLDIIASFSAELTGKEIEKLAKNPKVRWISFDAPLVSTGGFGSYTYRDEFTAMSYSSNNGTQNWNAWTEIGESDGTGSGRARVVSSSYCAAGSCLRIGAIGASLTDRGVYRMADLSGATAATLTFSYRRYISDNTGGNVSVAISGDGGITWTTLATYSLTSGDSGQVQQSFNITAYANSNTRVRFLGSGTTDGYLYVDNLQIEYAIASKFTAAVRADQLWANLKGQGVTVAVVDGGIASHADLQTADGSSSRIIAATNQISSSLIIAATNQADAASASDGHGHGTHVAGIVGGNGSLSGGAYSGVAPGVNLINVKVSNDQGMAITSDLIDGLQWILNNKAAYNIKVVNLSLNSAVAEPYHTSALDAAVEILWFNGIVVVVAAGNNGTGSEPVTLYPPANDPFVITVGAAEDKGTPGLSDDTMAAFSAYGTTESSFAKPDLVAPGRNIVSLLASTSAYAYVNHPANRVNSSYFRMSGTSMAAPVVSGAVALLLQDEPNLTPDQVKYRLKATTNTAWPGYDAVKAGAGYLDAYAAVYGTTTDSANTGLAASQMLATGSDPANSSVNWNSVNWNSVNWNSVNWNSVNWNSVNWNSVNWNSAVWDD